MHSSYVGNTAVIGGGIYNMASMVIASNIVFMPNNVTDACGGLYNRESTTTISNPTFHGNTAGYAGGIGTTTHHPYW